MLPLYSPRFISAHLRRIPPGEIDIDPCLVALQRQHIINERAALRNPTSYQWILWPARNRHHAAKPTRPQCEERRRTFDVQTEEHVAFEIASREGNHWLARVLPEVASQIARDHGQAMKLNGARNLAKCRSGLVRMAMATGALRSKQSGRRWITTAGEVADWIKRGRPAIG